MLGDRWSLIVTSFETSCSVIADTTGIFRRLSEEKIASNMLADRLARLVRMGLLSRAGDPTHKQKAIYSLTEASIQLVPLLSIWGLGDEDTPRHPGSYQSGHGFSKKAGKGCGKPSWQN
jgi:DNA-binding HxlR family transcriptional regulator